MVFLNTKQYYLNKLVGTCSGLSYTSCLGIVVSSLAMFSRRWEP